MGWTQTKITDAGRALIARAEMGEQLEFAATVLGDGVIGATPVEGLTSLISPKWQMQIHQQTREGTDITLVSQLDSRAIPAGGGFIWREYGVTAKIATDSSAVLFAYSSFDTSGGDTPTTIPDGETHPTIKMHLPVVTSVGSATEVVISPGPDPLYLTADMIGVSIAPLVDGLVPIANLPIMTVEGVPPDNDYNIPILLIDGGFFPGDDDVSAHNANMLAHGNLIVDAGAAGVTGTEISFTAASSLAEHEVDQTAHPNLLVDGNRRGGA